MAEWLMFWLLVPAIVVPVALLVGFAGCDKVFGLTGSGPMIDSAMGKDATTITLIWHWDDTGDHFQFTRTSPDGTTHDFDAPYPAAPFDDTGLNPAASYQYVVRGILGNGDQSRWSASVTGTTLPLAMVYEKTLTLDNPGWEGMTLVQRIEAAHLGTTGAHVRITVQASSASGASVERISISQANSAGKPYDSAPDLTLVYDSAANQQPLLVPAGTTKELPIIAYTINNFQALLIAVDFSSAPASGVERAPVPTSEAAAYYLTTPAGEAAVEIRSPNYLQAGDVTMSFVEFISKIETG